MTGASFAERCRRGGGEKETAISSVFKRNQSSRASTYGRELSQYSIGRKESVGKDRKRKI